MSQPEVLCRWRAAISSHFHHLSKPQARVLAVYSLGIALAKRCALAATAEALAVLGKPDTVERRLQRFLSNARIDWAVSSQALAAWVLAAFSGTIVVLLVDETSLQDKLKVMSVCLAYRGRAIPLAWWCYRPQRWPMAQVALIGQLLQQVAAGMPAGKTVLVQADRGIGCSPELLRRIQALGWYYLVRVQGQVRLRLEDGRCVAFRELLTQPARPWSGWVWAFKKAHWERCWAVAQWKRPHEQPWLLLTNWPNAQGHWYAVRMWEELAFRDLKSCGWEWQRSRVWEPEHANRLWLAMALAYVWTLSLGTQVIRHKGLRQELTRGKRWAHSVFRLGLRWLRRCISLGRELLCDLLLIPHVPILSKTVVQ
jgi:hypothetical protein